MDDNITDATALPELLTELESKAHGNSGRAAHTLFGGRDHRLRQTVIVMLAGHELAEHDSPGDASLQVLRGRVTLTWGAGASASVSTGEIVAIPSQRHALAASEDSAVLLTVALHDDWSKEA